MPMWVETERWAWEIPGYGDSDYTTYDRISCAMEIPHNITGELIYLPTGQKKTHTIIVNVVPYGNPNPIQTLNSSGPGRKGIMSYLNSLYEFLSKYI